MSAFIPGKAKVALFAISFALLIFLDAPEYILCAHASPDGIHDFPRIYSHEKSAGLYIERYNRVNKALQPYFLPESRIRYGKVEKPQGLLFHKRLANDVYVGDPKRQNECWKYDTLDDSPRIKSMNQSVPVKSIKKFENRFRLLFNFLNSILRI